MAVNNSILKRKIKILEDALFEDAEKEKDPKDKKEDSLENNKPEDNENTSKSYFKSYFNGAVEFIEHQDKFSVRITEIGGKKIDTFNSSTDLVIYIQGLLEGKNFEIDLNSASSGLMTKFEGVATFRWYLIHLIEKLKYLLILEQDQDEEETTADKIEEQINKGAPDAGSTGINN
jgi:hypothetical protein